MRKLFLAATAVATLVAMPAVAQQSMWMGQPAPAPTYPYASSWTNTYGATPSYGQRMVGYDQRAMGYDRRAASLPYASTAEGSAQGYMSQPGFYGPGSGVVVSVDGRYIGQDPDPSIQSGLERDANQMLGRGPT